MVIDIIRQVAASLELTMKNGAPAKLPQDCAIAFTRVR
jgi:hypothetical protein